MHPFLTPEGFHTHLASVLSASFYKCCRSESPLCLIDKTQVETEQLNVLCKVLACLQGKRSSWERAAGAQDGRTLLADEFAPTLRVPADFLHGCSSSRACRGPCRGSKGMGEEPRGMPNLQAGQDTGTGG